MDWERRSQRIQLPSDPKAQFWVLDLQEISSLEAKTAQNFLDDDTLRRSQQFAFEKDRNRHLIAHAFLRSKLGEIIGQKSSEITLLKNQYGKPHLEKNEVYFNLSHTKTKALVGIHPSCPIGVDIEDNQDAETFLRFWCAEEAYLKAIGTGFATERPKLELVSSFQGVDFFRKDDTEIYVYNDLIPGSKLAVCTLD